jgi:DNA-binding IclR family transcriptional regulator
MTSPDPSPLKYPAPALEKGLDILELLAARGRPVTVSQISAALGRSASELFRMLQALQHRGYVAPSETGEGLVLTNKLFALGMARAPSRSLHEAALPVMRQLSLTIGQSCHLAVASDDRMVVVARVEAPGDQGFSVRVGYSRPLVDSTSGLVLYAFQPEPVRQEWRDRFAPRTDAVTWDAFEDRALTARADGFVRADSATVRHVFDLSAPILDADGVAAALTSPYVETPTAVPVEETIVAIQAAAREVSVELGSIAG